MPREQGECRGGRSAFPETGKGGEAWTPGRCRDTKQAGGKGSWCLGSSSFCRTWDGRSKIPWHHILIDLSSFSSPRAKDPRETAASQADPRPARPEGVTVAVPGPEYGWPSFSALSPELFFLPCSLKALLIAQSELLCPRFPQPPEQLAFPLTWPLSSPLPQEPWGFYISNTWQLGELLLPPEEGLFAFHNGRPVAPGLFSLQLWERLSQMTGRSCCPAVAPHPLAGLCILISGLSLPHLWADADAPLLPACRASSEAFRSLGQVNAGLTSPQVCPPWLPAQPGPSWCPQVSQLMSPLWFNSKE